MWGRPFGRQRPGRPLMPGAINAPAHETARQGRLRAGSNIAQTMLCGIPLLRARGGSAALWARITGAPTGSKYPWRGIYPTAGGAWADLPATVSDNSLANPAYESNNDLTVIVGTRVLLRRGYGGDWRFQMTHC